MVNSTRKSLGNKESPIVVLGLSDDTLPLLEKMEKSGNEDKRNAKKDSQKKTEKCSQDITVIQRLSSTTDTASTNDTKSITATQSVTVSEDDTLVTAKGSDKFPNQKHRRQKLEATDRSSIMSLSSFSFSSRLRRHDDWCKWHNRKRMWYARSKLKKKDDRKNNDEKFLELLEEYKQKKYVLDCLCKRTRWSWFHDLWGMITNIFRYVRQFIWCCCCPPILGFCLNKVAFWPPPREYYFFINNSTQSSTSGSDRKPLIQPIVRKANKNCLQRKDWRFGFEHECATEIFGIECFVTRTEKKNHIACVFVRNSKPRYTLLFSHPNGSDISDHLIGLPNLHDAARFFNCNICAYDYSGYGISEGSPNEKNMYADINAVYKYLLENLCIPEANIILWGYSIGTVASVELAKQATKLAGLILLAPVASIIRTLCWRKCCWDRSDQCGRLADCCSDRFNLIKKIGEIEMPTLIAHGVQDTIVTVEHGKALYRLCPGAVKPLWVPDVGHNNLENSAMLWRRMRKFINKEARPPEERRKCKSSKNNVKKHNLKDKG